MAQHGYPNHLMVHIIQKMIGKRTQGCPAESTVRKMMPHRVFLDRLDCSLDIGKKPVAKLSPPYAVIVIKGAAQIAANQPMVNDLSHLISEAVSDLIPGPSNGGIFF